jgi:hypothetical protein
VNYIHITRNMGYEEEPDYEGLKNLFKSIMTKNGYIDDRHFDWFNLKVNLFFLILFNIMK